MKRRFICSCTSALVLTSFGSTAVAEVLVILNIAATALVQAPTTWSGNNYSTPSPTRLKIDNRTILQRLATVTGQTFPSGSQLALSTDTGKMLVVGRTNNVIADVSDHIGVEFDQDGPSVYTDKGNTATGADTTRTWFIGTLWYEDPDVVLYMTGLVITTETTSARRSDGSQLVSITGTMNNAVGGGYVDGEAILTGSVKAKGKGVVFE